jgi:hypothetical protein
MARNLSHAHTHAHTPARRAGAAKSFAGFTTWPDAGAVANLGDAAHAWSEDGFVILPGLIPGDDLKPALAELDLMYPSAEGFHDGSDPRRDRFLEDEFAGIDSFPFASTEVSLLSVHPRLVQLAQTLLAEQDLRIYGAEAWAKYTGAADYEQNLHRDYLNHTILVPSDDGAFAYPLCETWSPWPVTSRQLTDANEVTEREAQILII